MATLVENNAVLGIEDDKPPLIQKAPVDMVSVNGPAQGQAQNSSAVDFKGRFQILPKSPLSQFDSPCASAYQAYEFGHEGHKVVAMVCKPGMPIRSNMLKSMFGVVTQALPTIMDCGPIDWPATGDKRMVALFPFPEGGSYIPYGAKSTAAMNESDIMRLVAKPIISMLREMKSRNCVHRGIRLENLYWADKERTKLQLWETYSESAGCRQTAVYEPIYSAMCDPFAKGAGTIEDDIFSLGVLLLFLTIGKNPLADIKQDDLIFRRIEEGTFLYYVAQYPIPAIILEALRGMIVDDVDGRWTLDDAEDWIKGNRLSPKPMHTPRRAARPFQIENRNYSFCASLTYGLAKNWTAAPDVIRNKSLDIWLRRSMSDEKLADVLHTTINPSGPAAARAMTDDILVSGACMALDKFSPLHFRGFSCVPEGIGAALAMAMSTGDNEKITLIRQLLGCKQSMFWLTARQTDQNAKQIGILVSKYEMLLNFLEVKQPGFGLERCIYELNPDMPCLSQALKEHYVTTPKELLTVLDQLGGRPDRPTLPIDRHIAAFLGARMPEIKDTDLRVLNLPAENHIQIVALINLLAKLQRVHRMRELPGLTTWCADILKPVINGFKNIARRKRVWDAVNAAIRSGNIADVLASADNENEKAIDESGFKKAAFEHAVITLRITNLEEMKLKQEEIARIRGESAAVTCAMLIGAFFLVVLFYTHFSGT